MLRNDHKFNKILPETLQKVITPGSFLDLCSMDLLPLGLQSWSPSAVAVLALAHWDNPYIPYNPYGVGGMGEAAKLHLFPQLSA